MINRIFFFIVAIILILAFGSYGYIIIEDARPLDALYMTVITVTTVGFTEVFELSDEGKVFTIVLILGGVGVVVLAIGFFSEWLASSVLILQKKATRADKFAELVPEEVGTADVFESMPQSEPLVMQEVEVKPKSPLDGKKKIDVLRKTGTVIVAIKEKNVYNINVPIDAKLTSPSKVLVMGTKEQISGLQEKK